MGGNGSTTRKVSFGLDEDEKVTVIEGVKVDMIYERQQALVQEQLAQLAQRERESATATGLDELNPALIIEKAKAHEEQEKAKILARQLENREKELASISSFYKEQLEILERRNLDNYKQTAEQYNQAATEAEAHIRPRQTASLCTELQAKVLQCYRENPQQTLHCSSLAKQYMACVQQAKALTALLM
ncbi:MICOS complex subunit mic25 [Collichthys lucidus]|uniref:MICOS complex subunit mic25 n=1 Tax=Collichthys lucidus TaxID=240159 RepID=A0A4U5UCE5_COLLU|nr:MICOS complex subunit mic25 [Collichthys lucidus]